MEWDHRLEESPLLCSHSTTLSCPPQVKGGEKQEGILMAADKKGKDLSVLLGAVKPVNAGPPNERQQSPPKPWVSKMFFQGQDVVKIVARDVDLRGTKAEASNSKAAAAFGTDADISRGRREECVCSAVIIFLGVRVRL